MEAGMAPPLKRRKILDLWRDAFDLNEGTEVIESSPSFSHDVETLVYPSAMSQKTAPQLVEEVHLQIQQRAVADMEGVRALQPRQGTGTSTASTATTAMSSPESGSTAVSSSSAASSSASTGSSIATTNPSSSSSASTGSSIATTNLSTASAVSSLVSSVASAGSTLTSSSTTSNTSTVEATSAAATTSTTGASGSTSSVSGTNTSLSSTTSHSLTDTSGQPISTGISSSSTNSTTSITTSHGSSALTSATSFAANLSTTSTSHSSSTNIPLLFLTTLYNGDVETFSRSSDGYTTTLADGETFTVPAISAATTPSSSDSSMTSQGSTVTSNNAVTSVAYITTAMTEGGTVVPSTITSVATIDPQGAGQGVHSSTTSSSASSTGLASSGNNDDNSMPPAGTIAGGVVGGAAGLAVLLLIAMLFVRWSRRKKQLGHQALPPNSFMSTDPATSESLSSGPGMAERAGLRPLAAAVPGLFRHQDRSISDSEPSERGFTKVSGRKLPSQFSPGMSGPPPDMPLTGDRNMSTNSFYRDSGGFYSEGESPPQNENANGLETIAVSQGPQRRPTIHHAGGPYGSPSTSGVSSPPGTAATFADSVASLDPNRNSRFNEEL